MPTKLLERAILTVRNAGKGDVERFAFCSPVSASLSSVQVAEVDGKKPEMANVMDIVGTVEDASIPDGVVCTDYGLLSPLKKGERRELVVLSKVTNHMVAYPHERKQLEEPMVLVSFPGTMLSMYEIVEEKTTLKLGTPSSEVKKKVSKGGRSFTVDESLVTLEEIKNVKPFANDTMQLQISLPQPLVRARIERDIYVSHWGKVRMQELYDVRNDASSIKGEFSRVDFLLKDSGYHGAALQLRAGLPGGAYDIRYRDEIGNISTSKLARSEDNRYIGMSIEPRFPLFGGWHTKFELSYSLGLNWLVAKGKTGLYEMVFTQAPMIKDMICDYIITRVHLPEGSTVSVLPEVENMDDIFVSEERTFLSVYPRPVVTITQSNIVNEPQIEVPLAEVKYSYQPWLRFQQIVVATVVAIVSVRLLALIDLEGKPLKVKKA